MQIKKSHVKKAGWVTLGAAIIAGILRLLGYPEAASVTQAVGGAAAVVVEAVEFPAEATASK